MEVQEGNSQTTYRLTVHKGRSREHDVHLLLQLEALESHFVGHIAY